MEDTKQYDFLSEYLLELLSAIGLGDLNEEQKQMYMPKLRAELEYRFGEHFLPQLDESRAEEFTALLKNQSATPENWQAFWKASIPNFDEQVKEVLAAFADECREVFTR